MRQRVNLVSDPVEPPHLAPPVGARPGRTHSSAPPATPHDYGVTALADDTRPKGQDAIGLLAVVAAAARTLAAAGVASARVDAELLAAYVLEVPRGRLAAGRRLHPRAADAGSTRLVGRRARPRCRCST